MKTPKALLFPIALMILLSSACVIPGLALTQPSAGDTAGMYAAQTIEAAQTQSVVETVRANMLYTPAAQEEQPGQATATLAPSSTPLSTQPFPTKRPPTNTPPPPSPTPLPCNSAQFVADVTALDGAIMNTNVEFTKTWALMNTGSCIWTTDFTVVWESGERMNAPDSVALSKIVLPGQTVNVSVPLTTPDQPGSYKSYFMLRTDQGVKFGLGANADKPFWVRLNIVQKGNAPGVVYDLVKNLCSAEWMTEGTSSLACPKAASPEGAVFVMDNPTLEGNIREDEPAVVMEPSSKTNSYIMGMYPAISIRTGNRFKAIIGCLANSKDCTVTFELLALPEGKEFQSLGTWVQKSDKKFGNLSVDLSQFAGQKVQLVLKVSSNGDSSDDRAFWLSPRVTR